MFQKQKLNLIFRFMVMTRLIHGTRNNILHARVIRDFAIIFCPYEFWFRNKKFNIRS